MPFALFTRASQPSTKSRVSGLFCVFRISIVEYGVPLPVPLLLFPKHHMYRLHCVCQCAKYSVQMYPPNRHVSPASLPRSCLHSKLRLALSCPAPLLCAMPFMAMLLLTTQPVVRKVSQLVTQARPHYSCNIQRATSSQGNAV